jgi:flavin-dependent dehydrogenase
MRGESWLAVGDAAMTFDPLSSAGIFKGLRSGILASYAIADYFKNLPSGLDKFEAILAKEFEGYVNTRAEFYRQEKRWEDSGFWQRRYDYITLDPLERLKTLTPVNNSVVFDKVHGNLSVNDLKYLCELCKVARPAKEIVSDFSARRHLVSDRGVILALQTLLNEGLITSVGN